MNDVATRQDYLTVFPPMPNLEPPISPGDTPHLDDIQ
jgi:hypothetical protein